MTKPAAQGQARRGHVLVTGAAGMIGGFVVSELLHRGYQVIGLDNVTVATPASIAGSQALLFNGNRYVTMGAATSTLGASSLTLCCKM